MKIKVFTNSLFFYCFLWPFKWQNRFPWSVLCKYWWHKFKTWILLSKINFTSNFWLVLGNEEKIMICSFFKFSALEHFCGPKLISWVDIWVVLIWYSFQSVWVNLEGEFEKWTKCTRKMDKMQRGIKVTCFRCHPKRWNVGVQEGARRGYKEPTTWLWQSWEAMCDFLDKQI